MTAGSRREGRILPVVVAVAGRELALAGVADGEALLALAAGDGPWEVELGFGKGRYLLERAAAGEGARFLGVERAGKYYRLTVRRARRRGLERLVLVRGEALYLLAAFLPRGFARAVHVYFPDPWPKARHQRRRLFHPETVDLVVGLLEAGGRLYFATDHPDYGPAVDALLAAYPEVEVERWPGGWPEGPRTSYEAKYVKEGRPIVRLVATRRTSGEAPLHPEGRPGVLVAYGREEGAEVVEVGDG